MRKLDGFYALKCESECPELYVKHIATVVGRQPHPGHEVWGFNGQVHMDCNGVIIDPSDSPFIWLADYLPDATLAKHNLPTKKVESCVTQEMSTEGLLSLIKALKDVYHENLPSALLMLGAETLAMHYSVLQDKCVQVPAALAIGNVSMGKTKSAEAALSLVGMDKVSKVKSIN